MVKHIILWQLKDEFSADEKRKIAEDIKQGLEGLAGQIEGLVSIKVNIDFLPTSNADVMLYSVLEDEESLKGYAVHPDHVYAADTFVRPYTETRLCLDFEC